MTLTRLLIVTFAAFGIALKVLVGVSPDPRNAADMVDTATVALARSGFHVDAVNQASEIVVQAHHGTCVLLLLETRPQGWNRAHIRALAEHASALKFVYDGEILDHVPVYRATLNYQLARISGQLALAVRWHPVWALIADKNCESSAISWADLSRL